MPRSGSVPSSPTSVDKALGICETLSFARRGMSVSELARALRVPPATVHRLLLVLRRSGYVRQDEDTQRYSLTLKMLDLSFRLLGRSEVRLHAYPVLREYVIKTADHGFFAVPSVGEVTYLWSAGPDEVAMHTTYGKEMPSHCAIYFDARYDTRRLSCLRLMHASDVADHDGTIRRFGRDPSEAASAQRLVCTCAPVRDYTGQEVARVGLFAHCADDNGVTRGHTKSSWELARLISMRLGHLPAATFVVTA